MFDDVRYSATPYNTGFKIDDIELPINSDTEYEMGNLGHRIRTKGGYFPVPPLDSLAGHALRDALARWPRWASRSRSTTTRWPRPSTSSA